MIDTTKVHTLVQIQAGWHCIIEQLSYTTLTNKFTLTCHRVLKQSTQGDPQAVNFRGVEVFPTSGGDVSHVSCEPDVVQLLGSASSQQVNTTLKKITKYLLVTIVTYNTKQPQENEQSLILSIVR